MVVLALIGNALAAVFCPHMSGRQGCFKVVSAQHGQTAKMEQDHRHDAEMSEMDMSDEAMDMSDDQPGAPNVSRTETENDLESNAMLPSGDEHPAKAVTQPNEPCSHCMMHSQTNSTYSLRAAIETSPSYQTIAEAPIEISNPVSPTPRLVEVHDHGPPGSSAPLYVLVSSFRI
jgi:hypothetical protein